MTTRADLYRQAVEQVQQAFDILDQAHSSMRDARTMPLSLRVASRGLDQLLQDLATMTCEDCDEQLPCKCAWMQEAK